MKTILWISMLLSSCTALAVEQKNWEEKIYTLLDKGDSKQAIENLEAWKADNGENDPQYWVTGANIWFQVATTPTLEITALPAGEYRAEVGKKEELAISDPNTGKQVGKIIEGKPLVDNEKIRKAISFLDEGIQRYPYRLDIFVGRAHLYRTMEDLQGELASLESLVKDPKPKNGKYETGPGRELKGKVQEYQLDMLTNYAREHLEKQDRKNDDAAKAVAQLLIKTFPKRPHGYNFMGALASYEGGDWSEAKKWFLLALEQDTKDSLVIANLGNCYEKVGDIKSAATQYKRIIELHNDPEMVKAAKAKLDKLKVE